ncbi:hypothetical protein NE237_017771 [Protea cynaroides]|uniref:CBS domain-containing protein n=1 Tax=Protea cynaroides TaxID=273540 RepID=A0A9Q0QNC5_9MAGN|nr:hypothetical protein NE237_017771 [Protea cynaroides]
MDSSILRSDALVASRLCSASTRCQYLPNLLSYPGGRLPSLTTFLCRRQYVNDHSARLRKSSAVAMTGALMDNAVPPRNGVYTVGDFMTRKEDLHVVKANTTIDEALEAIVENRISGFPVIDDEGKLVGVVSDYDLLVLDFISGCGLAGTSMFPDVDSSWKTFQEIQKLLSKTNGKIIGDVMTSAPLVVHETTNLEDTARLLLETKYHRLPVVDSQGMLVGMITRENVVRAALQRKRSGEKEE